MPPSPSLLERVAYRALGVRLDERWQPWLEADLADRRWGRRHRLAQLLTFGAVGGFYLVAMWQIRGELQLTAAGGFVGAFLGQIAFTEIKRRQTSRAQLSPSGPWISGALPFTHRLVLTAAMLELVLAAPVAWMLSVHEDEPPCRPASVSTLDRLRRGVDRAVSTDGAVAIVLDDDPIELVAARVSTGPGDQLGVGYWAVRADGALHPLNDVAATATAPQPQLEMSFAEGTVLEDELGDLARCATRPGGLQASGSAKGSAAAGEAASLAPYGA